MDEARFGQKGTLTKMWAEKGSRPTVVRQTRYEWAYMYGAVDPATGESSALLARHVNTQTMNEFLKVLSREVGPDDHVVLVMDQAGWHVSKGLVIPSNITFLHLPPYSPELNCVERIWLWMRTHDLSNRAYDDGEHIERAVSESCERLGPDRIKSVCRTAWLERTN